MEEVGLLRGEPVQVLGGQGQGGGGLGESTTRTPVAGDVCREGQGVGGETPWSTWDELQQLLSASLMEIPAASLLAEPGQPGAAQEAGLAAPDILPRPSRVDYGATAAGPGQEAVSLLDKFDAATPSSPAVQALPLSTLATPTTELGKGTGDLAENCSDLFVPSSRTAPATSTLPSTTDALVHHDIHDMTNAFTTVFAPPPGSYPWSCPESPIEHDHDRYQQQQQLFQHQQHQQQPFQEQQQQQQDIGRSISTSPTSPHLRSSLSSLASLSSLTAQPPVPNIPTPAAAQDTSVPHLKHPLWHQSKRRLLDPQMLSPSSYDQQQHHDLPNVSNHSTTIQTALDASDITTDAADALYPSDIPHTPDMPHSPVDDVGDSVTRDWALESFQRMSEISADVMGILDWQGGNGELGSCTRTSTSLTWDRDGGALWPKRGRAGTVQKCGGHGEPLHCTAATPADTTNKTTNPIQNHIGVTPILPTHPERHPPDIIRQRIMPAERRRRNTEASQRFRLRKKARERQREVQLLSLRQALKGAREWVRALQVENGELRRRLRSELGS